MSASYAEGNATKTYFDGAAGRRRITAMLTLHVCHVMSTRRRSSAALTKSSPICSHVTRIKTEKFVKVTEKRSNYGYPLGVNSPCITEDNKLLKQLTANVDASKINHPNSNSTFTRVAEIPLGHSQRYRILLEIVGLNRFSRSIAETRRSPLLYRDGTHSFVKHVPTQNEIWRRINE